MGKPRSLVLSMAIDHAKRRHACQSNRRHVIAKGDVRLKVKTGRAYDHYCRDCAVRFLDQGAAALAALRRDLDETV